MFSTEFVFKNLNIRKKNFRDSIYNHENHESFIPRKFGAIRYGNTVVSMINTTYKTTKYVCMIFAFSTNTGYCVVADFIVQSETKEDIHKFMLFQKLNLGIDSGLQNIL